LSMKFGEVADEAMIFRRPVNVVVIVDFGGAPAEKVHLLLVLTLGCVLILG